ncbi:hypothetical protein CRG98_013417 [Punica granatum]|uniref:Uncharacterized protein n=1 Tax=Punica granatum TaxID=22663 RepID=A0A2I0KC92_PUNGR|nr:hypothetical protein CRG98_013417 [Punica granatum]
MTDSVGAKQTRLAPDEETDLQEAPGGLLMQDLVGAKQTRLAPDEETDIQEAPGSLLMQGRKETALTEAPGGISLQGFISQAFEVPGIDWHRFRAPTNLLKGSPAMFLCRKGPFVRVGIHSGDRDEFRKAVWNLFPSPDDPRVCADLFPGAVYWFVDQASGSPVRKAPTNVRECSGLSRRLLKCARGCHWLFWYHKGFLEPYIGHLLMLR